MDTDQVVLKGLFLSGASCRQHQLSNQPLTKRSKRTRKSAAPFSWALCIKGKMEFKLVSEAVNLFGLPGYLVLFSGLILYAQKKLRGYFKTYRIQHSESLHNLINHMKGNEEDNFFIIEQLFFNHFKVQIPYKGIKLILNSETPTENLSLYRSGRRYLEFNDQYRKIVLYKNRSNLNKELIISWLNYVVIGGAGVMMLLSSHLVIEYELLRYVAWYVVAIYLISIGIMGLDGATNISSAQKLARKYA